MRQVVSEAMIDMPSDRQEAVFGAAVVAVRNHDPAELGQASLSERCDSGYLRHLKVIPDTFDHGVWERGTGTNWGEWNRQAHSPQNSGDIQQWGGEIKRTRAAIAEAADMDTAEFDETMNTWWYLFASRQSVKCPNLEDFRDIDQEVALKVAFPDYPMELTVGFGGTNHGEVSSRPFGYVVPALDFAQTFRDTDKTPPSVRIFFAHELTASVNSLDANRAAAIADQTAGDIQRFTAEFYPDIQETTRVDFPKIVDIRTSLGQLGINGNAAAILQSVGQTSDQLADQIQKLIKIGERKGSDVDGTANYILGHVAPEVFGTYVDPAAGPVSVIKFGGPSEREFTDLQRATAAMLGTEHTPLSRTHSRWDRQGLPRPRQVALTGRNNNAAPYYPDRGANSIRLVGGAMLHDVARPADKNTALAAARAGGLPQLASFMRSLTTQRAA